MTRRRAEQAFFMENRGYPQCSCIFVKFCMISYSFLSFSSTLQWLTIFLTLIVVDLLQWFFLKWVLSLLYFEGCKFVVDFLQKFSVPKLLRAKVLLTVNQMVRTTCCFCCDSWKFKISVIDYMQQKEHVVLPVSVDLRVSCIYCHLAAYPSFGGQIAGAGGTPRLSYLPCPPNDGDAARWR